MTTFVRDLRVAGRSLVKAPGFAGTAIVTLALGMALCTTAVGVMKAYLLEGLPYPEADRLYSVQYGGPGRPEPRGMEALDWTSLRDVVEHPVAWDLDAFYLVGGDHAEMAPGAWVTAGFMSALGIAPALGRGFDAGAFERGSTENVVLISHRLWQGRFGADPGIVGRTFTAYVSDRPQEVERFTIIGVLPAGFWHINAFTDVLAPLRAPSYPYMVRLQPGVTAQQAAARITTLVRSGAREVPPVWNAELRATHAQYVARTRPILSIASASAVLVLLVACANVAALLLVRAIRRQKELAVRAALGARRSAIVRMLLAEALVLGGAATVLAVGVSAIVLTRLAPLVQQQLGRPAPGGAGAFAVDLKTMAFAVAVGLITAVFCTLAPLVTSTRTRFHLALQGGSRSATEGPGSRRIRAALIAVEIAVSLTLLVGTSLMLRSVVALLRTDLGFAADRVLMASITLRQNRYPDDTARTAVFERMESRLSAIPGVEAVGLTTAWPVQQPGPVAIEAEGGSLRASAGVHRVNAAYFPALDIALKEGRLFAPTDRAGAEPVAIISETLARRLWPAGGAIGRRVVVPQERAGSPPVPVARVIVGIAGDVRQGPTDTDLADAYVPMAQSPGRFTFVLTRVAGDPRQWLAPFRSAFHEIDPEIPVQTARPLQRIVDDLVAQSRFLGALLAAFATIAGALTLVGVYGVIAYAVRQREREIAVRMALGADPARLTLLFVRQGAKILAAGLVLGVLGTLAAGSLIENQLFGVTSRDPLALAVAVSAFGAAGLLALWWPSRRAASMDPAVALRTE